MGPVERISYEVDGAIRRIGLNRADKRNAFDLTMLRELSEAFTRYDDDDAARCAVLFAHGDHFTGGLDLAEVGPHVKAGGTLFPEGRVDPLGIVGRRVKKPVIMTAQGWCLTIGVELALAADIRLAAEGTRFSQLEVGRGIFPFGGATLRMPALTGWGNAMMVLLTGDVFDA
ncbi:MAG: enoyl-CoA hydratase/isomerase family protein, partial [Myxococcales bacterium]|nr:enoyl-CoA hydratase/isomerase family protein [Myxococcales bacterium]